MNNRSFLVGVLTGCVLGGILMAQSLERWRKSEVIPVVLVKPSMGSFIADGGTVLDGTWSRDQVAPMCIVKPNMNGFIPVGGTGLESPWSASQVRPTIFVKPFLGNFVPVSER
jgi:hypothetical protein